MEIEGNGNTHVSSDQTFGVHIFRMVEKAQEDCQGRGETISRSECLRPPDTTTGKLSGNCLDVNRLDWNKGKVISRSQCWRPTESKAVFQSPVSTGRGQGTFRGQSWSPPEGYEL